MKRTLLAAVVAPTVIGAGIIATTGVSQAESTYNFRLSNFSATVADICVHTDTDKVCSGEWPQGKSTVVEVRANSANDWKCEAKVVMGGNVSSGLFDRSEAKECYLEGPLFATTLKTKAP
ncbi:hypothetical protein CFN78_21725 [Amycolatopsis antarctica]|uniref:Uncharacterized protein n=2 Tax=Amycolatopsis antarctica TaxID=1854586 RepID=A0A263CY69_9PSEU|nr:hypothetical protein CFN78_21725 [Amycolatopsis antarctica]